MSIKSWIGLVLCVGGCASASVEKASPHMQKTPVQGARLEFALKSFNGEDMEGRLLVGTEGEALVLDRRLVEWIHVELTNVRSCDKKSPLEFYRFDSYTQPSRPEDMLQVQRGYWYGANVSFHLFDTALMPVLPECFEAEVWVRGQGGRLVGTLPIEVRRMEKGAPSVEGGRGEKPGT